MLRIETDPIKNIINYFIVNEGKKNELSSNNPLRKFHYENFIADMPGFLDKIKDQDFTRVEFVGNKSEYEKLKQYQEAIYPDLTLLFEQFIQKKESVKKEPVIEKPKDEPEEPVIEKPKPQNEPKESVKKEPVIEKSVQNDESDDPDDNKNDEGIFCYIWRNIWRMIFSIWFVIAGFMLGFILDWGFGILFSGPACGIGFWAFSKKWKVRNTIICGIALTVIIFMF